MWSKCETGIDRHCLDRAFGRDPVKIPRHVPPRSVCQGCGSLKVAAGRASHVWGKGHRGVLTFYVEPCKLGDK
jgi:hypothetical protein